MKFVRISLIIETILMYLSQLSIYIIFFLPQEIINGNEIIFLYLNIAFNVLNFVIGIIALIIAIIHRKEQNVNPSKLTMIIKLTLIPFYILNVVLVSLLSFSLLIIPGLFIAIPIYIFLSVLISYCFMLFTSIPNIFYLINMIKDKDIEKYFLLLIILILHFFFFLDLIGSILSFTETKKSIYYDE